MIKLFAKQKKGFVFPILSSSQVPYNLYKNAHGILDYKIRKYPIRFRIL